MERELSCGSRASSSACARRPLSKPNLFEIQADQLSEVTKERQIAPTSRQIVHALFRQLSAQSHPEFALSSVTAEPETIECNDTRLAGQTVNPFVDLAHEPVCGFYVPHTSPWTARSWGIAPPLT